METEFVRMSMDEFEAFVESRDLEAAILPRSENPDLGGDILVGEYGGRISLTRSDRIVVRDAEGRLYHVWKAAPGGAWRLWHEEPDSSDPDLLVFGNGSLQLVFRYMDDRAAKAEKALEEFLM